MATYTLTANADPITGSPLDDNFDGTYDAMAGVDTFNDTDILDGGDGIDTLNIDHFVDVAITPPDALWTGISNIENIVITTTGSAAQTITTGLAFEAAFAAAGVDLTTTTSGAGAINLGMSSFTGTATIATTSTDGAQTIVTGANAATVTAISGAGALDIRGIGLTSVSATTTGSGAQLIGDGGGNGANLVNVNATSAAGAQTIVSTSTGNVTVAATSASGQQVITTGIGDDTVTATTTWANNTINTGDGKDVIDVLDTSAGTYTLIGGAGRDWIAAGAGADTLDGGDGIDFLNGRAGADSMTGGDGNDTYAVDDAGDVVAETNASAITGGVDMVKSFLGAYTLGANVENGRVGSTGAANLTGNGLDNVLIAGDGDNVLNGGANTDTASYLYAGSAVTVDLDLATAQATGGSGSDTLIGIENLVGSNFNDTLMGNGGLYAGKGDDSLMGSLGDDTMAGGHGNDVFSVNALGDVVIEGVDRGVDTVLSSIDYSLVDTDGAGVYGGGVEKLTLTGNANINGTGNILDNTMMGNGGNNSLDGGAGSDTVSYANAAAAVGIDLGLVTAQDTLGAGIDTLVDFEHLIGSDHNDTLAGSAARNTLHGGLGNDVLTGGAGTDRFYFDTAPDGATNVDTITDFGVHWETIFLDNDVMAGLGGARGTLDVAAFHADAGATTALDADDRVIYDTTTGALYYDADGVGGTAAVQFATMGVGTHPALTSADFFVV